MWPTKNTAFMVIHGAGSHRPFETLDKFGRAFLDFLDPKRDLGISLEHSLQRRTDWVENYISFVPPEGKPTIDFYEYYWDCYMVRGIKAKDVINWIDEASQSAQAFYGAYKEWAENQEAHRASRLFRKDGDFKAGGYFVLISRFGKAIDCLRFAKNLLRLPGISKPVELIINSIETVIKFLISTFEKRIVGLFEDVDIYTCANPRSWKYEIRQKILNGAVEEIKLLLNNDYYGQVIIVGHSLGSVIAYDTLNRIILDINTEGGIQQSKAQKIVALVTFGSPLDKVAFFFREQAAKNEYIRRQILAHHHGFRSLCFPWEKDDEHIGDPVELSLNEMKWLNFFHRDDVVSGHLDAYKDVRNIPCGVLIKGRFWFNRHSQAHKAYWIDENMYSEIAKTFF